MKKIAGFLILALALASCQKESTENKTNGIRIVGLMDSENLLKTIFMGASNPVNWIANTDHIGVFSDRATVSGGGLATNVDYMALQNASSSTFSSATPISFDGTYNPHSFSAIYPYKSGSTFPSPYAWSGVPISLPAAQTQVGTTTTHIGPLDVMIAKTILDVTVDNPNPTLTFTFHHVFTILKFNVTCATAHSLKEISATDNDGRILSVAATNTIDIGQETPTVTLSNPCAQYGLNTATVPAGGTATVTLTTDLPITSVPASAYMVVYPQAFTGTFTITFKNENGTVYTLTKSSITLVRGTVYDVNVAIPNGGGANAWE